MKVSFIAPGLHRTRGGERVIFRYAEAMGLAGNDVTVIIPKGSCQLTSNIIKIVEYCPFFSTFISHQTGYFDAIPNIIKNIPNNVDVIISTYLPQAICGIIAKKKNPNAKLVLFNQDFGAMFDRRPERKLMFSYYPKYFDLVISISEFCASEIYRYSKVKSIIIPNGIEEPFLINNINAERNYILWVGSKNRHKGFKEFYEAMQIVWIIFPAIKVKVVGGYDVDHKNIEYASPKGDIDQLINLYSHAQLFVCSSYEEGFGLPALEAMACGCPVITTDTGGCREYAINGINCEMCQPRNSKILSRSIIHLLNNPKICQKYSEEGLVTVKKFNWNYATSKFIEVINRLVKTNLPISKNN